MKRKTLIFTALLLLLGLFTGFSEPDYAVLAGDLSENAEVKLFAPSADTELFAYTDEKTHILKTDGSASCVTVYPASAVLLCGQRVLAFSPFEDFTAAEIFDADTLSSTDLIGLPLAEQDILDLDADRFGRIYAVRKSEPELVHIYDAAGSPAGQISCPEKILGIQVLHDQLYITLPKECLRAALGEALPQSYGKAFSCSGSNVPFHMLSASAYISTNGGIYATSGTPLTAAGQYSLRKGTFAAGSNDLFWAESDFSVIRFHCADGSVGVFSLPDPVAALSDTAAVVRTENRYCLVPFGSFQPLPAASPSPLCSTLPGVSVEADCIYLPAGTTAAALRDSLSCAEVEIRTASMAQAAGKIRTGWTAATPDAQYTLIVPGDVNGSGTVNSMDLRLMQQILLSGGTAANAEAAAGDLNRNGELEASDLVLLVGCNKF